MTPEEHADLYIDTWGIPRSREMLKKLLVLAYQQGVVHGALEISAHLQKTVFASVPQSNG